MRKGFGIITPAISPFRNGVVDVEAVDALTSSLKRNGVRGIFAAGSTGCAPLMDAGQQISVIRAYAEHRRGMRLFAGIGRNSVNETLDLSRAAIRAEADALVLVTPYYIPMRPEEIVRYYDKLLSLIDFDVMAYSIPQFTGSAVTPEVFERIRRRHRNLIGIKDSSGDFLNFSRFCLMLPEDTIVFQGRDNLLLQSLMLGASGGVCGSSNFDTKAVQVFKAFKSGSMEKARRLQSELDRLIEASESVQFPLAYHYAFYRKVMHTETINALSPFYRNDAAFMKGVRSVMKGFL